MGILFFIYPLFLAWNIRLYFNNAKKLAINYYPIYAVSMVAWLKESKSRKGIKQRTFRKAYKGERY